MWKVESLPDKMFLSSSLDVISSIIGSLKESVQPLVEEYNLISVLTGCMEDNDAYVRQAAFGVLGDLAQYCYIVVKPHIKTFVMLCVKYMNVEYALCCLLRCRYPSVCNNAIWSLGEMVLRAGTEMALYAEAVLPLLISFNSQTRLPAGIKDNSTISICRYCLTVPQAIPYVRNCFGMLCTNVAKLR